MRKKKTKQDAFHHIDAREAQATKGLYEMRCNTKINVLLHCNSIFTIVFKIMVQITSFIIFTCVSVVNFKAKSMS